MKRVAIHTPDRVQFPNLALMKLSAWHKRQGDKVEWFLPLYANSYDVIYSSKVFTYTPNDLFLPDRAIRGGTGYSESGWLPDEVEHIQPDYGLYLGYDFGLGFLTRGCIRACPWCIVPKKEGKLRAHAQFEEFVNPESRNLVFMDNNVLASPHGLREIERLCKTNYKVDFNQGLDARLIAADESIVERLSGLKWFKPLRLACDTKEQMPYVEKAVELLRKHGCTPRQYSCYVLVKDIDDALERVEFLRKLNVDPFAQPYIDFEGKVEPTRQQKRFARWVNRKQIYRKVAWKDYR